jgi:hypothetical protein
MLQRTVPMVQVVLVIILTAFVSAFVAAVHAGGIDLSPVLRASVASYTVGAVCLAGMLLTANDMRHAWAEREAIGRRAQLDREHGRGGY